MQPALAAGPAEPGDRDPVADLVVVHILSQLFDNADALVSRDERRGRLDRPIALRGVDVGVAEPAGLHPDQDLAGCRRGAGTILDLKGAKTRSVRTLGLFDIQMPRDVGT